jgi:hypothetical protein
MTLAIPLQILVRVHDDPGDPASVSIASLAPEGDRSADSAVMTAIALARHNRNSRHTSTTTSRRTPRIGVLTTTTSMAASVPQRCTALSVC